MGKAELVILTVLAIAAISLYTMGPQEARNIENKAFEEWKLKFNKKYSPKEEAYRISIWLENLAYVEAHNKHYELGLETHELEMNAFADMRSE